MSKKNTILLVIIILVLAIVLILVNKSPKVQNIDETSLTQVDENITTDQINKELNSVDLQVSDLDSDFKALDNDLNSL